MFRSNSTRLAFAIIVMSCFVLAYGFAAVPDAPPAGAPACVLCYCRNLVYWWTNGDATTVEIRYKNIDGNLSQTQHALVDCYAPECSAGAHTQSGTSITHLPNLTKRICTGAVANRFEILEPKVGNVNAPTTTELLRYQCGPLPAPIGG